MAFWVAPLNKGGWGDLLHSSSFWAERRIHLLSFRSVLSCEKSSPLLSEISPYPPLSVKEGERIVSKQHPLPPLFDVKRGSGGDFSHSIVILSKAKNPLHTTHLQPMDISPYKFNMTESYISKKNLLFLVIFVYIVF